MAGLSYKTTGKTGPGRLHLQTPPAYTCTLTGITRAASGGSKRGKAAGRQAEEQAENVLARGQQPPCAECFWLRSPARL